MDKIILLLSIFLASSTGSAAVNEKQTVNAHNTYTGVYESFDPVTNRRRGRLELKELQNGKLEFSAEVNRTGEKCEISGIAVLWEKRWKQWFYSDPDNICQLNIRRKGGYIHLIPGSLLDCRKRCPVTGSFTLVFPVETKLARSH
jgi:hypothetical protein